MINRENIGEIFNLLSANYGEKMFPDDQKKMANVVNLWQVMFADDDPAEVLVAVKDCIATLQFPPKIADIKSRISQNRTGQMTEMDAWSKIVEAINRSYSKDDANKEFFQLPAILQRIVGSPSQLQSWRLVEVAQLHTVVMSAVLRSYRELVLSEETYHALPADMQKHEEWRLSKPVMDSLPEPKREQTLDEMEDEMDRAAREYREKYLMPELKEYLPKHYTNIMEKLRGCG